MNSATHYLTPSYPTTTKPYTDYYDGDTFFDTSTCTMHVYNGSSWQMITLVYTPELDPNEISWVQKQYAEHLRIEEARKEYPALDEALKNVEVIKAIVLGDKS